MRTTFFRLGAAVVALLVLLARPAAAGDGPPWRLLAFGDSLVQGYGLPEGETFPAQLEAALRGAGHEVTVVNGGSSGDTTRTGRSRLDWVVRPDIDGVIVVIGANDALRGLDPAKTRANLDAILTRLGEKGLPTLLAGMKAPRNMGDAYATRFDRIYPALAEKHDVVFDPFFLDGVAQDPDLNQDDGIHPNAAGVAVIVERMRPEVETLLTRIREADGET